MAKLKLISSSGRRRQQQATHVDREEIGAVSTPDCHGLEQATARDAHLRKHISSAQKTNRVM